MSTTVSNYKIYCETEAKYVSGWGTTAPTTCYNNNAHSVNLNSVQIISSVASNEVIINQRDSSVNGGRFHIESIFMDQCLANDTTIITHTFDIPMGLFTFNFAINAPSTGDLFSIQVNPDTPLGLIASNASISDTKINISAGILPYMFTGFYLTLTDGTNTDGPYKILSKDSNTNTVTLKTALTHNYLAINTQMLLNYYVIKDMPVLLEYTYSFGSELINGSTIPAGTVAKFTYVNNTNTDKQVAVYLSGLI